MLKEFEIFWDYPAGFGGGHKNADNRETGGAEPEGEQG